MIVYLLDSSLFVILNQVCGNERFIIINSGNSNLEVTMFSCLRKAPAIPALAMKGPRRSFVMMVFLQDSHVTVLVAGKMLGLFM